MVARITCRVSSKIPEKPLSSDPPDPFPTNIIATSATWWKGVAKTP
ncbi:hypothetical protein CCACVL1_20332 [Corchorus capsularis]|uniref:Uncharacterized protein n=1 Tax=Corchorus capsularis TaxID=210143 RepID=A0A1R3HBR2_COCAP|nr:hypothetical protein CCACVL1_20332 [Corchorus capsularis]